MMKYLFCFLWIALFTSSCEDAVDEIAPSEVTNASLYFPPVQSDEWENVTPEELGWETEKIPDLLQFLEQNNTRAFLLLKNGKIALEYYGGKTLAGQDFSNNSNWYWASAGKTLTAFLVGIAQEEGYLDINHPSSDYLGEGWTSLSTAQEAAIKVSNQLSMNTGLDEGVTNKDCTDKDCLQFLTTPNSRWAYHNAAYTLLDGVVEGATQQDFDTYFNTKIANPIGMTGFWQYIDYNHVFFSNARSMARFGLLILNKGKWQDLPILSDEKYYEAMVNTSQTLNESYGYLWWLNGKNSYMLPGLQTKFTGSISPDAPQDMVAAVGKNGQLLCIVQSQNLVLIRMGDLPTDGGLVPISFQNLLWQEVNKVMDVE
ncbi:MAG: serine hydrolase domain-containing protein [Bacteroidota bacterium]